MSITSEPIEPITRGTAFKIITIGIVLSNSGLIVHLPYICSPCILLLLLLVVAVVSLL